MFRETKRGVCLSLAVILIRIRFGCNQIAEISTSQKCISPNVRNSQSSLGLVWSVCHGVMLHFSAWILFFLKSLYSLRQLLELQLFHSHSIHQKGGRKEHISFPLRILTESYTYHFCSYSIGENQSHSDTFLLERWVNVDYSEWSVPGNKEQEQSG